MTQTRVFLHFAMKAYGCQGEMGDELITFLDSDDKLADDAVEKAVQYFEHMKMSLWRL